MFSLRANNIRLREPQSAKLYPLDEALEVIGITAPTFYRWLKAGKIDECRVRGCRGKTMLRAEAIVQLRGLATRVEYVH